MGLCNTAREDLGSHTVCTVVTAEFSAVSGRDRERLDHPATRVRVPLGLRPVIGGASSLLGGDWPTTRHGGPGGACRDSHERSLDVVPLDALLSLAVDVPSDPSSLL